MNDGTDTYTVWGMKDPTGVPVRLFTGHLGICTRESAHWERRGWVCVVREFGDAPSPADIR